MRQEIGNGSAEMPADEGVAGLGTFVGLCAQRSPKLAGPYKWALRGPAAGLRSAPAALTDTAPAVDAGNQRHADDGDDG